MIILGVDPGRSLGFCRLMLAGSRIIYVDSGTYVAPAKYDYDAAIEWLARAIVGFVSGSAVLALESGFIGKGVLSAMKIGEMRGMIKTLAWIHDCDVVCFSPSEVKLAATGNGGAKKPHVAAWLPVLGIEGLPGLGERGEDETDAIAIAYTYCRACIDAAKMEGA